MTKIEEFKKNCKLLEIQYIVSCHDQLLRLMEVNDEIDVNISFGSETIESIEYTRQGIYCFTKTQSYKFLALPLRVIVDIMRYLIKTKL